MKKLFILLILLVLPIISMAKTDVSNAVTIITSPVSKQENTIDVVDRTRVWKYLKRKQEKEEEEQNNNNNNNIDDEEEGNNNPGLEGNDNNQDDYDN